jgi:hypothetical protein
MVSILPNARFRGTLFQISAMKVIMVASGLPTRYTVMPLRVIRVSLFPVWKWNRGQVLFKAI